jgi:hypothetical protein
MGGLAILTQGAKGRPVYKDLGRNPKRFGVDASGGLLVLKTKWDRPEFCISMVALSLKPISERLSDNIPRESIPSWEGQKLKVRGGYGLRRTHPGAAVKASQAFTPSPEGIYS